MSQIAIHVGMNIMIIHVIENLLRIIHAIIVVRFKLEQTIHAIIVVMLKQEQTIHVIMKEQ